MQWVGMSTGRYPKLRRLYHVPNGGRRPKGAAGKVKGEGQRAGVLDYCLPVARGGYHGLYFELKIKPNRLTPGQRAEIDALRADGYRAEVCWSWQECSELLTEYLESGSD